jgi:5-methylcytosine-specific restriction endonuclease McrA
VIWRSKGGTNRTENLVLLHPNCHIQLHSQGLSARNRVPHTTRGVRKA